MASGKLRVSVLGGGSWGTTVAHLTAARTPTLLWARSSETADDINQNRTNARYLGNARLNPRLRATTSIAEAVAHADVLILGVPSQAMRETAREAAQHIRPWVPAISLAKGFEGGTGKRMTEVVGDELPGHPVGVLTGPNLAREILDGMAAASAIAMEDAVIVAQLQKIFSSGLFRVYSNTDLVGSELGGALKNVFAIAAGMGDGLGAGVNTRSALLTRSIAEMTRLGVALGGRAETFAGLTGLGDLITTCTSEQSRNRSVGYALGKGQALADITASMQQVAEGVKSCGPIYELACKHGVEVPIITEVYNVLHKGHTPKAAFRGLLRRGARSEAEPG